MQVAQAGAGQTARPMAYTQLPRSLRCSSASSGCGGRRLLASVRMLKSEGWWVMGGGQEGGRSPAQQAPGVLQRPPSPNSLPPPEAAAHSEPRTSQGLGPTQRSADTATSPPSNWELPEGRHYACEAPRGHAWVSDVHHLSQHQPWHRRNSAHQCSSRQQWGLASGGARSLAAGPPEGDTPPSQPTPPFRAVATQCFPPQLQASPFLSTEQSQIKSPALWKIVSYPITDYGPHSETSPLLPTVPYNTSSRPERRFHSDSLAPLGQSTHRETSAAVPREAVCYRTMQHTKS